MAAAARVAPLWGVQVRSAQPIPGSTGRERYGFLEQNFDRSLLQLFSEVRDWERLE